MDTGSILLVVGSVVSAMIGGSLVFLGQWFTSRQSSKTEVQKWKQEEQREVRRDIVRFREDRAKPVFEALDRVAHRWDIDSIIELAEAVGYEGEKVNRDSDEYKQRKREQKREYFDKMQKDISSARVIHDSDIRGAVSQILWQSTDPEAIVRKESPILQDVYLRLENWIFNPQLDYNTVQLGNRVSESTTSPRKETTDENRNG